MRLLKRLLTLIFFLLPTVSFSNEKSILTYIHGENKYEISDLTERFVIGIDPKDDSKIKLPYESHLPIHYKFSEPLPIHNKYAFPIKQYSIAKKATSYKQAGSNNQILVKIKSSHALKRYPWDRTTLDNSFVITGWITGDTVKMLKVNKLNAEGRWISNPEFSTTIHNKYAFGFPAIWIIKNGTLVPKENVELIDSIALGTIDKDALNNLTTHDLDQNNNNAVHLAAMNGHSSILKQLILSKKVLLNKVNIDGHNPLILSSQNGRIDIANLLIQEKTNINQKNGYGQTAIMLAAQNGHTVIVESLIKEKASFKKDGISVVGSASLYQAIRNGHTEIALQLIENGAKFKLNSKDSSIGHMLSLFSNGYPEIGFALVDLLKIKKFINKKDHSIFHSIASYADIPLLERVLKLGLDPSQKTTKNVSPIDFAISSGNVPAICWFIENGANPIDDQDRAVDAIAHATNEGQLESVQCLINFGNDVNNFLPNGATPLMLATHLGHKEIAESIIDAGGTWALEKKFFMDTCLARAIEMDSVKIIDSAIEQGYDPSTLLFGQWNISTIAEFYQSDEVTSLYKTKIPIDRDAYVHFRALDQELSFLQRTKINYPENLQAKHGNLELIVRAAIDYTGRICFVSFENSVPPEIEKIVRETLVSWKFTEPLKNKTPVSSQIALSIPLHITSLDELALAMEELDVKPRAIKQPAPHYPAELAQNGIKGTVDLEWIITSEGKCSNIKILDYSHIGFAAPAYRVIEESTFSPGEKNGEKVDTRVTQRIMFRR
ncbi:ankyrin repeat domain-containing protein [Puniceicoccaceae bacterium K14]|nr:ankyrin repeat domain-containing protein [Puniceicoccaceae bacterium K14]